MKDKKCPEKTRPKDWPTGEELIAYWEAAYMSGEAFNAFHDKHARYLNRAIKAGTPEHEHVQAVEMAWYLIRSGS